MVELDGREAVHGRLSLRRLDEGETDREVDGADCTEVASALALMLALTVDPEARVAAAAPQRPVATVSAVPPSVASPKVSPQPAAGTPPPKNQRYLSVGAHGGGATVMLPHVMGGGSVFVQVGDGAGVAPSLRLGMTGLTSGVTALGIGEAMFQQWVGTLDVCGFRFVRGPVSVAPCAGVEAGVLHGDGYGVSNPGSPTRAWVALGGGGQGNLRLMGPLFLDLDIGLMAPLNPDSYYFNADKTKLVRPDVLGVRFGLGLAARFP